MSEKIVIIYLQNAVNQCKSIRKHPKYIFIRYSCSTHWLGYFDYKSVGFAWSNQKLQGFEVVNQGASTNSLPKWEKKIRAVAFKKQLFSQKYTRYESSDDRFVFCVQNCIKKSVFYISTAKFWKFDKSPTSRKSELRWRSKL